MSGATVEVVRSGPLATLQDLGRPGLGVLGVSRSGAADRPSHRLANRLVGNPESAATLELTLGGALLRFAAGALVAVTGARTPMRIGDRIVGVNAPVRVDAGERLRLGAPATGLRSYLAVRGGFDVPAVLGSRSTDLLSGIGPPVVNDGSTLSIGPIDTSADPPGIDLAPVPDPPGGEVPLRIRLGPRDDWFAAASVRTLTSQPYQVTPDCDRVGVRLAGPALERAVARELPSEGLVAGAVQVPPSGQPVVLLADHPVTGGYPVVAVVAQEDLALVAQLRPGQRVRFHVRRAA